MATPFLMVFALGLSLWRGMKYKFLGFRLLSFWFFCSVSLSSSGWRGTWVPSHIKITMWNFKLREFSQWVFLSNRCLVTRGIRNLHNNQDKTRFSLRISGNIIIFGNQNSKAQTLINIHFPELAIHLWKCFEHHLVRYCNYGEFSSLVWNHYAQWDTTHTSLLWVFSFGCSLALNCIHGFPWCCHLGGSIN